MDEQQRPVVHEGMGAPELVEALRAGDTAVQKKGLKALMRQPVALPCAWQPAALSWHSPARCPYRK